MKRLLPAIMASLALLSSVPMQGAVPVIDPKNLQRKIQQFFQDQAHAAQDRALAQAQRQLDILLNAEEQDNTAAGFGQVVAHQAAITKQLHDAELRERGRGDRTACHNQAVRDALHDAGAHAEHRFSGHQAVARGAVVAEGVGLPVDMQRTLRRNRLERMESECRLGGGCLSPDLLLGGSETMGTAQVEAVNRMAALVIGPDQPLSTIRGPLDPDTATMAQVSDAVGDYRRMALLSLAHASMSAVAGHYVGVVDDAGNLTGHSQMAVLNEFVDARLGPESEWLKMVANAHQDYEKDPVMPAEVARQHLVVDAYRAKMGLYLLEGALRREMLLAAILSVEVTPL